MIPIDWRSDPSWLIFRKIARCVEATKPGVLFLEALHVATPETGAFAYVRTVFERWILGAYIYRGYRQGLNDYGPINFDR
jgi:hypothetical protein